MADWNALLPQAPAVAPNIATDPAKVIGLMGQLNQNALFQQIYRAREGIGQAYQENVGPDGVVNEPGLRAAVAQRGGFMAPETMTTVQGQEGQRITNDTDRIRQGELSRGIFNTVVGTLNPNATPEEFARNLTIASKHFDPRVLPSGMINGAIQAFKNADPATRIRMITDAGRSAIGPDRLMTGQQEVATPGAGKENIPVGEVIERQAPGAPPPAAGIPPATPRGLPTAVSPAEGAVMQEAGKQSAALRATVKTRAQDHADLSNLKHYSTALEDFGGPTAEMEKSLNTLAIRAGLKDGVTLGKDKLAAAQEFTKITSQMASNQQKQMSDAGLHISEASNPNLMMGQVGRNGVIDMLRGNRDALDRTEMEWAKARKAGWREDQHFDWASQFANKMNVRVFQFNRMDKEAKQKFLNAMPPDQARDLAANYNDYKKNDWLP